MAVSFSDSSIQAVRPIITVGPTYRANQKDKKREYERVHTMFSNHLPRMQKSLEGQSEKLDEPSS